MLWMTLKVLLKHNFPIKVIQLKSRTLCLIIKEKIIGKAIRKVVPHKQRTERKFAHLTEDQDLGQFRKLSQIILKTRPLITHRVSSWAVMTSSAL